ncbi:MAG: outer membrane protein/peptidoglycan-associated protein [Bacteroidota bacterium]|jgi:outer membrane protein OmpA-like peptidoglycan-associated protein|nr:outer membrane protein/peptidoglycan-associated protein [Bacteroidota bacterium]
MKKIFTIIGIFSLALLNAQTLQPTETQALLTVVVVDKSQKPLEGEEVTFIGKDLKVYSGYTSAEGKFDLLVPEGDDYKVQYKAFSENMDYNHLKIPSMEGTVTFEYKLIINPPKVYTLDNVFFDTGKSTLKPESSKELNELAEYMIKKKSLKIEIAGHTDNIGNKDANQKLSEDRANSVKTFLVKKGVDQQRVMAKGYGDSQPVADNGTDEGRQKNRRTEVRSLD